PLEVVAVLVALEVVVAGLAEALPDRVGLVLADGAHGLPLALQALQLGRGRLPVDRVPDGLRLLAQSRLLREVRGPLLFALALVLLATREEHVGGLAEAPPDRLRLRPRHRSRRLPLRLQPLQLFGGLEPVGRLGEGLRPLAQRLLGLQVGEELGGLFREVRVAARLDLVAGRPEAIPEHLALFLRGFPGLLPAGVQVAQRYRGLLEVFRIEQRFRLHAQLFLHRYVGPPLPLGVLAELLPDRVEGLARALEPR